MNLTSYLVNKCFEYLLDNDSELLASSQSTSTASCSILPPWAHEPQLFKSNCDGCGICLANCNNNILISDNDGYPRVDFSAGPCSFCGDCAESCPRDAFRYEPLSPPWSHTAFISDNCLAHNNVLCRTCAEHCEEEAIIIEKANGTIAPPGILADKCNGCGACFGPCPARAITFVNAAMGSKE